MLFIFSHAQHPVPNSAAVVALDNFTRLTILTSTLVRLEVSPNGVFDDRATLAVVNRASPVPPFSVVRGANGSSTTVNTTALSLSFLSSSVPAGACSGVLVGTDAEHSMRSPTWPRGIANSSISTCCSACEADPSCIAWVLEDIGLCLPLSAVNGTRATPNRTFGLWVAPRVSIAFTGPDGPATWSLSRTAADPLNLNGTYLSLDASERGLSGPMAAIAEYATRMRPGLLSRAGYAVLDDVGNARTEPTVTAPLDFWLSAAPRTDSIDFYFQSHGTLDFRGALREWSLFLGSPALLPKQTLGVMWSLYFAFNESNFIESVLQGYANYSIPLSTIILDDDWHEKPIDKTCSTWGNYDVNVTDWPGFSDFVTSLHAHGNLTGEPLRLSLNLHPDSGVDHCNARYTEFARAMGADASHNATIPCDLGSEPFASALASVYSMQRHLMLSMCGGQTSWAVV